MTARLKALLASIALSLASGAGAQTVSNTNPYLRMCDGVQRPIAADSVKNYRPARTASGVLCWVVRETIDTVTPPVNPPVIPVGSGEPVYDATRDVLVLSDNMDRYTSKATMTQTGVGFHPGEDPRNELQITSGRSGNALRVAYQSGTQTGASWDTHGTARQPDTVTHVVQYYARFTFSAPLTGTLGIKNLMLWHTSGNDRMQFHLHWRNSSSICPESRSGAPYTFLQTMDASRFAGCQGAQPVGPFIEQVADGQWHRFTAAYRPHSTIGRRDGYARFWIDGVKVIDVSAAMCGVGVTPIVPAGASNGMPWCTLAVLDHLAVRDGVAFLKLAGTKTTSTPTFFLDVDDLIWFRR